MFSPANASRKRPLWSPGSVEVASWADKDAGITKAALEQLKADVVTDLTCPRPQSRPIGAHDELKLLGRKVHQLSSFVMHIVKILEAKIDTNDKKHMGFLQEIQDELRGHGNQLASLQGGMMLPPLAPTAPPVQEKKEDSPKNNGSALKPVPPSAPKAGPTSEAPTKRSSRKSVSIDNSAAEKLQAERAAEPPPEPTPKLLQLEDAGADGEELNGFLDARQSISFTQDSLETFRDIEKLSHPETVQESVQEAKQIENEVSQNDSKGCEADTEDDGAELSTFVDPRGSMNFKGEDIEALVESLTGGGNEDLEGFLEPQALDFSSPEEVHNNSAEIQRRSQLQRASLLQQKCSAQES